MDWSQLKYFKQQEFHGEGHLLAPSYLMTLDRSREVLGESVHISPVKGSVARFGGSQTSQHYVGTKEGGHTIRLSTAADIFVEGVPFLNFTVLQQSGLFSGIGIYLDTTGPDGKPWVMFHLDTRKSHSVSDPLVWICTKSYAKGKSKNIYHYPQRNSDKWLFLKRNIFFKERSMS